MLPHTLKRAPTCIKVILRINCSTDKNISSIGVQTCNMNLSTADLRNYRTEFHETWWSYRYMFLVDPKVFRFVVKGVKAILLGVQRGLPNRPLTLSTHLSNFDDIGQCWIFTPPFLMPCFGSYFENDRHLENFENTELLL
jgi:hypothetical protein